MNFPFQCHNVEMAHNDFQNLVTWPLQATREMGKCSLLLDSHLPGYNLGVLLDNRGKWSLLQWWPDAKNSNVEGTGVRGSTE